jgi:Tol biopolymer transport system component
VPKVLRFTAALSLVVACSDGTGPGSHGLNFTAGDRQTDTVYAELSQALNVRVFGAPRGTVVRFEPLPFDSLHTESGVYVGSLTSRYFGTFLADSTDASGEAHARIKLGPIAGPARLRVSVPALNRQAFATFTILPGRAFRVIAFPKDTALYVSGAFQSRGAVTDRFGNPRPDPVTYNKVSGSIAVSATGQVTASAISRASYEVRAGNVTDTGYLSVVPSGTIAAMRLPVSGSAAELVTLQLDGSSLQVLTTLTLPTYDDPNPRWHPDGTRIGYSAGVAGASRLFTVTMNGAVSRLIMSPPADLIAETWPHYTHDGAYVYFAGASPGANFMVWRVATDGTGAVRISPDSVSNIVESRPAPSSDGTRIAYVYVPYAPPATIRVKYLAGDTTSTWFVYGNTPRWDPRNDRLAYVAQYGGPISVINGDGTGARVISQPGRAYEERTFDWSPDGRWIVARGSNVLELIDVTSGLTLPLGYSSNLNMPIWRP